MKLSAMARGYIGLILTKISALRGCCTVRLPQDQKSLINNSGLSYGVRSCHAVEKLSFSIGSRDALTLS